MQSKKRSFIESITNVVVGFSIGFTVQVIYFKAVDKPIILSQNFWLGVWMTVLFILRSYCIRRFFTNTD